MIRRIITLLMAYTIGITCISAQNQKVTDANIGGHVIDTENGEHMPGCLIKILGTSLATVTDASGHYIFRDLKPGDYTLE
ncbi:MAG: carboxypeptidase-like regulatory domain-containing protein, partial [Duncaniella sp.]|nr:carboxypeptidase-like regulatory domain-containing protein [Duncaniella sp.]